MPKYNDGYVLGNTWATFEAHFMRKLSKAEAKFKKSAAYKKKRVMQEIFSNLASFWNNYNPSQNFLGFLCFSIVSVHYKQNYIDQKLNVQVNSWVAEELKTYNLGKWGNFGKPQKWIPA